MKNLKLSLALIIILAGEAAWAASRYDQHTRIRVIAPREIIGQIEVFADTVNRGVEYYLGVAPVSSIPIINVIYDSTGDQRLAGDSRSANAIIVPSDSQAEAVHKIASALFLRRIPGSMRNTAFAARRVSWLAAAVYYDVVELNRHLGKSRPPNYQPVYRLLEKARFPEVEQLLEYPVAPAWPNLYKLYAKHSHLLINLVKAAKPRESIPPILQYLQRLAESDSAPQALAKVLAPLPAEQDKLQVWYESRAPRFCVQHGSLRSADGVLMKLEEILMVKVISGKDFTGEEKGALIEMPLSIVAEVFPDYHLSPQVITDKFAAIVRLQQESPPLFRPPLASYLTALNDLLRRNNRRSFRRLISRAEDELNAVYSQDKRIQSYMREIETIVGSDKQSLGAYLEILRDEKARRRELLPEIEDYLDEFN